MRRSALALFCALLLVACASDRGNFRKLDEVLYAYAGAIRWGDLEGAFGFVDPKLRSTQAPTALERERVDQLQISGYYVQGKEQPSDEELRQVVEIRVINRHTQVERSVLDRQVWRWDAAAGRWWLVSGLPDFSPR